MQDNREIKVILSGPVGAGKSSAISTLSDTPPVVTDVVATDDVAKMKKTTTVAMDYGAIDLGEVKVHLYGTPGQERFDFMWDILAKGALGLVLLIKNSNPDPVGDLRKFLRAFANYLETTPVCIGVTHMDEPSSVTLEDYYQEVQKWGVFPVFAIDARSKKDTSMLIMSLLGIIDPDILGQLLPLAQ